MSNALVANKSGKTGPSSLIGQRDRRQVMAETLEGLAIELRSAADEDMATIPTQNTLVALASKMYSGRRQVDEIFGMKGFSASPAWDIVLDLYQAKVRGKRISVTSACIGSACPATTGLRWLQALEGLQLVERRPDPEDKRRSSIELTDGGLVKVEKALSYHL